jgi:hypothetical protein
MAVTKRHALRLVRWPGMAHSRWRIFAIPAARAGHTAALRHDGSRAGRNAGVAPSDQIEAGEAVARAARIADARTGTPESKMGAGA